MGSDKKTSGREPNAELIVFEERARPPNSRPTITTWESTALVWQERSPNIIFAGANIASAGALANQRWALPLAAYLSSGGRGTGASAKFSSQRAITEIGRVIK